MNAPEIITRPAVTIRASSFGSLFDCPSRWIAIHLEGRRVPQNGKAALGTAIHAGTASFDAERVAGQTPSLSAAQDAAVDSLNKPREETAWEDDKADAEKIAPQADCRLRTFTPYLKRSKTLTVFGFGVACGKESR